MRRLRTRDRGRVAAAAAAASGMKVGLNLGWVTNWTGASTFRNLCFHMGRWVQAVGSGSMSQSQGVLTAGTGTDEFKSVLIDTGSSGTVRATGEYTILNPSGSNIGIGDSGSPSGLAYGTATTRTFTYSGGTVYLWVKGSALVGSGPLVIVKTTDLAGWNAGNIWSDEFLAFMAVAQPSLLRTMDMTIASENIETDWADRSLPGKISLHTKFGNVGDGGPVVPWEYLIDLANRLDKDVWICVPARATSSYVTSLASLWHNGTGASGSIGASGLEAGRKVWVERGNESTWNETIPWVDGLNWIRYSTFTKRTATVNAATDVLTLNAHGIPDARLLRGFHTKENREAGVAQAYQTYGGFDAYASDITANTFKLRATAGGTVIDFPTGTVNYLFIDNSEAGKTAALEANFGALAVADWAAFDSAMTHDRCVHVLPSHNASPSKTTALLAVSGVSAATDYVAVAPYYEGYWFGGRESIASGSLTPAFWCNRSCTIYYNLWSSGTVPRMDQRISGTGAIASSHEQVAYTTSGSFTNGTAVTGLANGTNYERYTTVEYTDQDGLKYYFSLHATVSPNATPATTYIYNDTAQQDLINRLDMLVGTSAVDAKVGLVESHIALGKPVVSYESGLHFHESAPAEISTWLRGTYMESDDYANSMSVNLYTNASIEMYAQCWYSDVLGASSVFNTANSYSDTTDKRVVKLGSFGGTVPIRTRVSVADLSTITISADPGSFPYTVSTLADATLTYRILRGDNAGNFDFSGATLRMVADVGIGWTAESHSLTVLASDGYTEDVFTIPVTTGVSAYDSNDLFAWDSTVDTNNAAVNPDVGSVLSLTAGSGATVASGLWDNAGASSYSNATALTAAIDLTKPTLIARVVNKDNMTDFYTMMCQVGTGGGSTGFFGQWITASGKFDWRFWFTGNDDIFPVTIGTGDHVIWAYLDPATKKVTVGLDQTTENVGGTATTSASWPATIGRDLFFNATNEKYGSWRIRNATGMTITDAKAVVQTLQTLHGIA